MGPLVSLVPHKGPLILSLTHQVFHCFPSIFEILLASFRRSLNRNLLHHKIQAQNNPYLAHSDTAIHLVYRVIQQAGK